MASYLTQKIVTQLINNKQVTIPAQYRSYLASNLKCLIPKTIQKKSGIDDPYVRPFLETFTEVFGLERKKVFKIAENAGIPQKILTRKNPTEGMLYRSLVWSEMLYGEMERAKKELKDLSHHDELTGIPNRRFFNQQMEYEFRRAARNGQPLSLLIIDANDFKIINDTWGHPAGDKVLSVIAKTMQRLLRRIDSLARWGGDEFVVLLPETNISSAKEVGQKLRKAVEQLKIPFRNKAIKITISVGIASFQKKISLIDSSVLFQEIEEFKYQADQALYKAKKLGKNLVLAWDEAE